MSQFARGGTTEQDDQSGQGMLYAWIALQLAGQITLPILIATLLFHKRIARRNPTVINLCIVWTLATIPPELLFYAGKYKHNGPAPGDFLCLVQAATISAVPPMAAMAYLSVVIHAATVIYEIIHHSAVRAFTLDIRMIFLLSSPYLVFFAFSIVIAVVGAQNPVDIRQELFFCEVLDHGLSVPVFSFTIVVVMCTLLGQLWIAIAFYRNVLKRRRRDSDGSDTTRVSSVMDIQLLIRMVAFTAFEIIIVVASVASIFEPRLGPAQLLLATPPFAVFLIFATSKDVFGAWFPCLVRRRTRIPKFTRIISAPFMDPTFENDLKGPYESHITVTKTTTTYSDQYDELDLENGLAPPILVHTPPREQQIANVLPTTLTVESSNPSDTDSPLDTIRALRALPTIPRPKPRP
ncbi:hypothetical protein K439DRAFT_1638919 [Ramaria rubella]|nr:hypothetical protein K439DRAFT_1638919 [Ramaria rubella]